VHASLRGPRDAISAQFLLAGALRPADSPTSLERLWNVMKKGLLAGDTLR
jgi:hypothetical protein